MHIIPSARSHDAPYSPRHTRNRTGILSGVIKAVAVTAAVGLVSTMSIGAIALANVAGEIQTNTVALGNEDEFAQIVDIGAIEGGVNLVVAGSDTRLDQLSVDDGEEGARNDVTMLMHISQDHNNVSVISFPRDLMIDMPECSDPVTGEVAEAAEYQMLNTALGRPGGLACVAAAVSSITGLPIGHAAAISFDGVAAMTNAVGGVEVCIATAIDDDFSRLHLEAGNHVLAGQDALNFLRTRKGVGGGSDLDRISSQQVYLSALARKVLSDGTLSNPVTLYSLAQAAGQNMQLSASLASVDSMVAIAKAMNGVDLNSVAFLRYPVMEDYNDPNRVMIDDVNAALLNQALLDDAPLDLSAAKTADSSTLQGVPPTDGSEEVPTDPVPTEPQIDPNTGEAIVPAPTSTSGAVILPDGFTGQTADQVTCSVGN